MEIRVVEHVELTEAALHGDDVLDERAAVLGGGLGAEHRASTFAGQRVTARRRSVRGKIRAC
jgi:hypothetical protein